MAVLTRSKFMTAAIVGIMTGTYASSAPAAMIMNVYEAGNNVVVTASGTVNTAGLNYFIDNYAGIPVIEPSGLWVGNGWCSIYTGFSGPGSIGSGNGVFANSYSGDLFAVTLFNGRLFVPQGYVSGTPLSGTSTANNATLAQFGFVNGTYVYTWGTGPTADSLTINVGIPEPASLSLLSAAGFALLRRQRRRRC
ncbi:MAG: PEP-CTERM sorting domain-containing protein [Tepidisphaeraceae bacterium]